MWPESWRAGLLHGSPMLERLSRRLAMVEQVRHLLTSVSCSSRQLMMPVACCVQTQYKRLLHQGYLWIQDGCLVWVQVAMNVG